MRVKVIVVGSENMPGTRRRLGRNDSGIFVAEVGRDGFF